MAATTALFEQTGEPHVSKKQIADRLEVGRSAAYDRINRALLKGYLVNAAPKDSRLTQIQLGAPLPDGERFLPTVEELESGPVRCADRTRNPAWLATKAGPVR